MKPRQKLTDRLPSARAYGLGVSEKSIIAIPVTDEYFSDILLAIESTDAADNQMGLFFAASLPAEGLTQLQRQELVSAARTYLAEHLSQAAAYCAEILIKHGQKEPDYRSLMLRLLRHPDVMARMTALNAYTSYARPREIAPLQQFENDSYASELGIGSPLFFILRDQALKTIETITGHTFHAPPKSETLPNGQAASYRDWAPFLKWKNAKRSIWQKLFGEQF